MLRMKTRYAIRHKKARLEKQLKIALNDGMPGGSVVKNREA